MTDHVALCIAVVYDFTYAIYVRRKQGGKRAVAPLWKKVKSRLHYLYNILVWVIVVVRWLSNLKWTFLTKAPFFVCILIMMCISHFG